MYQYIESMFSLSSAKIYGEVIQITLHVDSATTHNFQPLYGLSCVVGFLFVLYIAETVKLLLAHNADVNLKTKSGDTPLHGAVFGNNPQIFQALLGEGLLIFQQYAQLCVITSACRSQKYLISILILTDEVQLVTQQYV